MPQRFLARAMLCCALPLAAGLAASPAGAQGRRIAEPRVADSTHVQIIKTRDGTTLVGRIVEVGADSVRFQTSFGPLAVARSSIAELREVPASSMRGGTYWPADPNLSRLFFAPTGRMLPEGDGYFSDHYLFFLGSTHGVTDRFTLGGGMSVLPFLDDFTDNVVYLTPKVGLLSQGGLSVAAGALIAHAGGLEDDSEDANFGIAYAVATIGSPDGSVTLGTGFGYTGAGFADRPVAMLGAHARLSRRVAFATENYILPGDAPPLVSYGLRFFGDRLSVDLAFVNLLSEDAIFPGIPFVGFSVHY